MKNIAIFFTDKEYTNDNCVNITLEEHLYNVEHYCSTPDCWDSFYKISEACKQAEMLAENGNPCLLVDLGTDATEIIETFE